MSYKLPVILSFVTLLSACTNSGYISGGRTHIDVGFYDIGGKTYEEIDQQIALHGPTVKGVGKAIAATDVEIIPNVKFKQIGDKCAIRKARVKVKAEVILPRLKQKRSTQAELRKAFGNLQAYAKAHEAVHVSIADKFAQQAEQEIEDLPPRKTCQILGDDIARTFKALMKKHEKAQLRFDQLEKERLKNLSADS